MKELMELLEMQKDLDNLIQEAVGELTVSEFQTLQESGVLNEGAIGKLLKGADALHTYGGRVVRRAAAGKVAKSIVKNSKKAIPGKPSTKSAADSFKAGVKKALPVSAGIVVGGEVAKASPLVKANTIYQKTGNAVMACKAVFKDPAKVKACAARLYARKGGVSKVKKLRDIVQDKM